MSIIIKNLYKALINPIGIIGFIIGFCLIFFPSMHFLDPDLIQANIGVGFYYTELSLTWIISLLFGIFLGATLYKIKFFSVKKSGVGVVGGLLGVLVSGCPACSITLASYIGLAGIISVLPYHGLELKVISVFFLLYACYITIRDLEVCKIKKK